MANQTSILFITTTNLAANPRLTKELRLATANGFRCTVVQFRLGNWSDEVTLQIKNDFPAVTFIDLSALRSPYIPWLYSSLLQKFYRFFPPEFLSSKRLSYAIEKRSFLLLKQVSVIKDKFDWVIAHNPAAFYPAFFFAERNEARLGIDVEDYHPGETQIVKEQTRMKKLMKLILPEADYCSYAAPLIAAEAKKHITKLQNKQQVILNGFYSGEFAEPVIGKKDKLQLVWFSQNIDAGRGLEHVIPVINRLSSKVELHLVGEIIESFEKQYLQNKEGIVVHSPMLQKNLHQFLSRFDAGLATDIPINHNRDIALTNKMIAYAQAGLIIAAMHTSAQDLFLKESNLLYVQMENEERSVEKALLYLYALKERGGFDKMQQFMEGQKYCWENISKPLIEIWKN